MRAVQLRRMLSSALFVLVALQATPALADDRAAETTVTGLPALLIILVILALLVIGVIAVIKFVRRKAKGS